MSPNEVTFMSIMSEGTYGFFAFLIFIIGFILLVLWILLPFAVFKIKSLLSDSNVQLMRMNKYLMSIEGLLKNDVELSREHIEAIRSAHSSTKDSVIDSTLSDKVTEETYNNNTSNISDT